MYVTRGGYVTPETQTKSVTKDATTSYSFTLSLVPPDTGSIEVTSVPGGAEIFINAVDTGFTTPHTFNDKVVGSYDVYVTRGGYVTPETQTKSVTKDATTSYSFTLSLVPPDTGSIEVTSDSRWEQRSSSIALTPGSRHLTHSPIWLWAVMMCM